MSSIWRAVIGCCVILVSLRGYAEEWKVPMVQVTPMANGWAAGASSKIQWMFDQCNDGKVSARKIVGDARPGGDGECVEVVCEGSPRGRLFFRNATPLTIPAGTEWLAVWIKGVKGKAERLEGSFHFVDSKGLLNGTVLSLPQLLEIQGDGVWKQYVFRIPPLKKGAIPWAYDPLSKVDAIAWPLTTVAMGWKLAGRDIILRMDDWTAGSGNVPQASFISTLDPTKPRALSVEETVETWFNAWINWDRDMVMLYNRARLSREYGGNPEVEKLYYTKAFPLLMTNNCHAVEILAMEKKIEELNERGGDAIVEVIVKAVGGWEGRKRQGGYYLRTRWATHGLPRPWYLNGGF